MWRARVPDPVSCEGHRSLFGLVLLAVSLPLSQAACAGEDAPAPPGGTGLTGVAAPAPAAVPAAAPFAAEGTLGADPGLGDGLVVWESNRGGAWRIWGVDLAPGSKPRRVSPDEPGRVHCCPHLSPDGSRLVFLSLPPGGEAYEPGRTTGPLLLLELDGGNVRVLAPAARTYFENRAAVWRGDEELVFIDGDGRTRLLELATGAVRRLTDRPEATDGWLLDPRLAFATRGRPSFSPYDAERRAVNERAVRGGCQPYFSGDGRWGYWVAGAGGPVNRVDLATGETSTILAKADRRMIDGYGYAYFPMFSDDGRAFAYAASRGEHSHVDADYEVFLAASDPATLELTGGVRRITRHAATDRFPDVHLAPQPLGVHRGEVPFELELSAPAGSDGWRWSFGDGGGGQGGSVRHVYARPGDYRLEASRDGELLTGSVRVRPAAAPRPVTHELVAGGREVVVTFDEEIAAAEATVTLVSGRPIESRAVGDDGRSLIVRLAAPLERADRLEIAGVRDRASRPNAMEPARLELWPPRWPVRRDAIFLWQTADRPNLFFDAAAGTERAGVLERSGRAFLDRDHRMVLQGGRFAAGDEESNRLRWALQATNEMALELMVEPLAGRADGGALVHFGRAGQPANFALLERGGELVYRQRVASRGAGAVAEAPLVRLPPGRSHLVLSFSPGRLTLDVDGERVVDTDAIQGDFFHWRSVPLTIGGRAGGGLVWMGAAEGLALYDRASTAEQARESFARYRDELARRQAPPELVVEARLAGRSPTPSLTEIRPYREALAVHRYEVERVIAGEPPGDSLRVAHWELLDGERQPPAAWRSGERVVLRLEPFAEQPQLAGVFVANRFERPPVFFAVAERLSQSR